MEYALPGLVLAGLVSVLFAAAVSTAAPAAAIDDPARPDARVTHGPSCRPGGLVVEVQGGTTPYFVRLATTRAPAGEAEAELAPGQTVVLRTGDVAHGETIDGRLEYTARDGSGTGYVDELENYSFTRPSQEDCDAITAPASAEHTGPVPAPSAAATTSAPGSAGGGASPATTSPGRPGSGAAPAPAAAGRTGTGAGGPGVATSTASARRVTAGTTVVLHATGFLSGERVTILLHAGGRVLGSAVADDEGVVRAEVRIPGGTAAGAIRLDLVGDESAVVTDVELHVAAAEMTTAARGTVSPWAVSAAAVALVGSVGGLVSVSGRRRALRRNAVSSRTAFSSGSAFPSGTAFSSGRV